MNSNTNRRVARVAALALAPVALVSVSAPGFAADGSETSARAGTGALVSKTMSARTVLTSTSGKKLTFTIGATGSSSGTTVSIGLNQGSETHMWSFKAKASDLKIGSTGAGSLTLSSTQTGDRGKLNLKFSPIEAFKKQTCGGKVASKTRKMGVNGIAYFKTGTKGWGNVGKSAKSIKLSGGSVMWSYDVDCPNPGGGGGLATCSRATSWNAFQSSGTTFTSLSGTSNGAKASVSALRSVQLPKPAGASRIDIVNKAVPVPTLTRDGEAATLVAKGTTGSMKIASDGGFGNDYQCRSGSDTLTGHDQTWMGEATNNSPAFTVGAQVFGAFKVPNGVTATITKASF